jgi:hypothetical protein
MLIEIIQYSHTKEDYVDEIYNDYEVKEGDELLGVTIEDKNETWIHLLEQILDRNPNHIIDTRKILIRCDNRLVAEYQGHIRYYYPKEQENI